MTLFLLFSHQLTLPQQENARKDLGITQFRSLPEALQNKWSQVPTEPGSIRKFAEPIWAWLAREAKAGDHVLVQGDFGMTYATVSFCLQQGLIPVYATTRRESKEVKNEAGQVTKTLVFQHVRFRRYETSHF